MGVFSKLKNIFYDEEYVDEPVAELKKVENVVPKEVEKPRVEEIKYVPREEEKKVVIEETKREEPKVEPYNEREMFRSERTFNFTEFDDEDELPPRRSVLEQQKRVSTVSTPRMEVSKPVVKEPPKVFKPSPIISPIYGIIDKDFKRDDVVTTTTTTTTRVVTETKTSSNASSYDSVRRKAYGTLEDDLEDTLNSMTNLTTETISKEVDKIDRDVEELDRKAAKIEELITKLEKSTSDLSIGELEEKIELDNFEELDDFQEEIGVSDKTMTDSSLEHDLFNLIDSMYDDKED